MVLMLLRCPLRLFLSQLLFEVLVPETQLFIELLNLLKGVDVLLELGAQLAVVEHEGGVAELLGLFLGVDFLHLLDLLFVVGT